MIANLSNLPILIGTDENLDKVIDKALRNPTDNNTLIDLSRHFRIRIKFNKSVEIQAQRRYTKIKENDTTIFRRNPNPVGDTHTFIKLFDYAGRLAYSLKRNSRHGYELPYGAEILEYEPVIDMGKPTKLFQSYEEFKKKFDPSFITEAEIQRLWNTPSGQTGQQYNRHDFKGLGTRGREVLKQFLQNFKGITSTDPTGYTTSHGKLYLSAYYNSRHNSGRDIKISHMLGHGYVWYSSEFHGCGNGTYGLLANRSEYLWLEND